MTARRSLRTVVRAVALTLALCVSLSACGDDDSGKGSGTTGKPTPSTTLAGDPIIVGSNCSCSGVAAASLGPTGETMQAWEAWVNTHGGVNGHPVKLILEDDGADPTKALQLVKKMVEEDKVVAIVGEQSLADGAFVDYLHDQGIPMVGGASVVQSDFRLDDNVFLSGASKVGLFYGLLKYAEEQGQTSFKSLVCSEFPACAESVKVFEAANEYVDDMEFTGGTLSLTAPNYTAECLDAKEDGTEALLASLGPAALIKFATDCKTQGYEPAYYNLAPNAATTLSAKSSVLDGTVMAAPNANYLDDSNPSVKEFLEALDAYDPDLADGESFPYGTISAWAGGKLFEAAAKASNLTPASTAQDLKTGLLSLKDETLGGLAPPLNFGEAHSFTPCTFLFKIADGHFESLNDGEPVCADPSLAEGLAGIPGG